MKRFRESFSIAKTGQQKQLARLDIGHEFNSRSKKTMAIWNVGVVTKAFSCLNYFF
jgi:hypothetical protein